MRYIEARAGNVTIGHGSTIYAGTMITQDIPPYSVVRTANTDIAVESSVPR